MFAPAIKSCNLVAAGSLAVDSPEDMLDFALLRASARILEDWSHMMGSGHQE